MVSVRKTDFVEVYDGSEVFYREAGDPTKQTILLLHGFPTSSHMYRDLIPILASKFHVVAPDLPGFGFTKTDSSYRFTFENLANTIILFLKSLNIEKFIAYVFDYGAPVAYRIALKNPSSLTGLIIQNGNAYNEGLSSAFWDLPKAYWKVSEDDSNFTKGFSEFLEDPENIKKQYLEGVKDTSKVDPSTYTLDLALMSRPGQTKIQLGLFYDYKTNVDLYPKFQEFLRSSGAPVLVAWGKNDYIFSVEGADAYKRDVKNLKFKLYDASHFVLETHLAEISKDILEYFG